jgi:hypothetical protein
MHRNPGIPVDKNTHLVNVDLEGEIHSDSLNYPVLDLLPTFFLSRPEEI